MRALLVALPLLISAPAFAQDAESPPSAFAFGGAEISEGGFFTYLGGGARIDGDLDTSGLMIRAQGGYGRFDHVGPLGTEDGEVTTANLMLGYQFVNGGTRIAIYAGPDYQRHDLPNDPANPVAGSEWGGRIQGEAYSETENVMLLGIASYSTANDSYFLLGKAGFRVGSSIFVGPEAGTLGNDRFDQYRIGAHVTGFRIGPVGLGVEAGYVNNSPGDDGIFGAVGFTLRF